MVYRGRFDPIALGISGFLFFTFVIFREDLNWFTIAMGATPVFMAVMIGAGQNILSKGTKCALFDPTKEMSYIPLDQELKVKGKAAVDVIGGRFRKIGWGIDSTISSYCGVDIRQHRLALLLTHVR